jgi:hypothetical protein
MVVSQDAARLSSVTPRRPVACTLSRDATCANLEMPPNVLADADEVIEQGPELSRSLSLEWYLTAASRSFNSLKQSRGPLINNRLFLTHRKSPMR